MPLTTDGLIEDLRRFRADKLALVGLVGSMGTDGPADALARLRDIRRIASERLVEIRRLPRAERRLEPEDLWRDIRDLAGEVEPWLAQLVERTR